ncbi:MAG: ABC transporter ATP-binding protein [Treponema sp.]|jgi:simple sugar transport system ATP-binding protein|nr:ABC transporter ATP-binding protein [Treponema sp.]
MRGIGKIYPGGRRPANSGVSLDLRRGEILCLAGENGAGKSTLMKILCGLEQPSEGEILINGKIVAISSPLEADRLGVGMVHQHFMLFSEFTVAENVVMGREPRRGIFFDAAEAVSRAAAVIKAHRFPIEPEDLVSSLTLGQMQQVEICMMLYRNADIIILDEPTAVLTEQETASLFKTLAALKASGKSVILITHKPDEIKKISDRVAVLRKGTLAGVRNTAGLSPRDISVMMVGESTDDFRIKQKPNPRGGPVIVFDHVTVRRRRQEHPLLKNVSFTVSAGEILGFAGVSGNGLGVLEAVLGGFLHPASGRILHQGKDVSRLNISRLRNQGLSFVPADRLGVGSAGKASVAENMIIDRRADFSKRWIFNRKEVERFSRGLLKRYEIDGECDDPLSSLSGGNIQKVILAREIDQFRDYIVFSEPAWGLDVAASARVYAEIAGLRDRGAAVILISTNLDEILSNADRIIVMYRGSAAAELPNNDEPDIREKIGAYMLGIKPDRGREDMRRSGL